MPVFYEVTSVNESRRMNPIAVTTHTGSLLGIFSCEESILPHISSLPRRRATRREVCAAVSELRRNLSRWQSTGRTDDTVKNLIATISKNIKALEACL